MAPRRRSSLRDRFGAVLGALLLVGACLSESAPAKAQGFGWFGGLLGGGTPQRSPSQQAYPGYRSSGDIFGGGGYDRSPRNGDSNAPRRRVQRRKRPVEAPPQQTAAVKKGPKTNPTVSVDVFGDGFGLLLAGGLDEALADRQEVAIVRKARGSTGLVNTAFYDWPKAIDEMVKSDKKAAPEKKSAEKDKAGQAKDEKGKDEKAKDQATKVDAAKADKKPDEKKREKIDVAVMMIGSNDRQPIVQDGKTYQRGSDEWNAIYRKRVLAIAEAFQRHKIPLIWVGLPITKDDEFADDMAALNEIYKDVAVKTGATYVDSWEVFSDEKGDFAAFGPDINGQMQRLRTPDGLFFTHAGARKLAHFVETHLRRDIDGKIPPPQLPTAAVPETGTGAGKTPGEKGKSGEKKPPSVALAKPEAGPIKNLGEAPSAKDGMLMQLPGKAADEASIVTAGRQAPANRVDNFRWPAEPKTDPKAKPAPH